MGLELTWNVGDTWTVLVIGTVQPQQRAAGPREKLEDQHDQMAKTDTLRHEWREEGEPAGVPFEEYLRWRRPSNGPGGPRESDSPYQPWMRRKEGWRTVEGKALWAHWKYSVLRKENVGQDLCFVVKMERVGWLGPDDKDIPEQLKKKPEHFFTLCFRVRDRSLAKVDRVATEGERVLESEEFAVSAPVKSVILSNRSSDCRPPVMWPALERRICDPLEDFKAKGCVRAPGWTVAQKMTRLKDSRIRICLARQMATIERMDKTKSYYEVQFWRAGLPWWEEAYGVLAGGERAKLHSWNGKAAERLRPLEGLPHNLQ